MLSFPEGVKGKDCGGTFARDDDTGISIRNVLNNNKNCDEVISFQVIRCLNTSIVVFDLFYSVLC